MKRILARVAVVIATATVGVTAPLQAPAQTSMAEGFSRMEIQTARRDGYAAVRFGDGTRAERFILKAGDCPKATNDCNKDRERIEFAERPPAQPVGAEVWVAWDIYLPADFQRPPARRHANIALAQFHQRDNSGPELMFFARNAGLEMQLRDPYRLDDDPMNPVPDFRNVIIIPWAQLTGRWNRVEINAKWSRGADGFVKAWVNGSERWSYTGPTTNSNGEIYFKYGIYRSFVSRCGGPCPTLTAYYRKVKRGRSREDLR